jgi:hypothetical protein
MGRVWSRHGTGAKNVEDFIGKTGRKEAASKT